MNYLQRVAVDRKGRILLSSDIVGKKASLVKLCKEGKLKPRKCRRWRE